MKVTLDKVIAMNSVLSSFRNRVLSAPVAYFFAKLSKEAEDNTNFYHSELKKIIDKYGQRDENGEIINNGTAVKIIPELQDECEAALKQLADLEVDMTDRKIKIDDLLNQTFTMEELMPILMFIED